jgi:hypothetical protein
MKYYFLKNIMRITYALLILYLFIQNNILFSQNNSAVKGIVKDSVTGEAIPYAIIQASGTKIGTNANVYGFYYLDNIPIGKTQISVSAVGYQKKNVSIDIDGKEIKLFNFALVPEPKELKAVVKTADRIKEVYETNISVQAITQEEIKMVPMIVERDIFKIIKILPGVSSTGDVTSQFYVRGGGGDQNLILYDNMMIYNPFHALGLFSIFNANSVKISEVLTGGFKPEFGGRLSSVVNIISKDGNKNNFGCNLDLGMLSAQGLFEGPLLNGSFITTFRKSHFDNVLKKMIGQDLPLNFYDFTGKVTQSISPEGRVTFNSLISHDEIKNSKTSDPNYFWDNNAFGLNISTFIDTYFANVSFSTSHFKASVDHKGVNGKQKDESEVSDFLVSSKIEYRAFGKDMISYGFSFLFPRASAKLTNNSDLYIEKKGNTRVIVCWFNYQFKQLEDLVLDLGLRNNIDYIFDDNNYIFEPRLGFKYNLYKDFSIKGSYSRYFQFMVTTSNEDDVIPLFEYWMAIESPYKPERCDEYVFGFDMSPVNNSSFQLQGYYKYFNNLLGYNLDKTSEGDPDFSEGKGISYGLESVFKFQTSNLYVWLDYTLSWSKIKRNRIIFYPRYDKRHIINIMAVYKLPWDIDLNLHWELSSGAPFTNYTGYYDRLNSENLNNYLYDEGQTFIILGTQKNNARLPWYHKLDLGFTRSFIFTGVKMNAAFDIINLYDHKNIFYYKSETGEFVYMLPFLPTFSIGIEL